MISNLLLVSQAAHSGFLPTRGSGMLDFLFLAMFLVTIVLTVSLFLVIKKRDFRKHRVIQMATAVVLAITVIGFEIDMRFLTDWETLANPSRWYDSGAVHGTLWLHLLFAIPTPFVWAYTIYAALKKFPNPPAPGEHSAKHRFWGRLSAILLYLTALTGIVFYVVAFVM